MKNFTRCFANFKSVINHSLRLLLASIILMAATSAWGETAVPTTAGTYSFGSSTIGASYKFAELSTNSVFIYRNSSWSSAQSGIKANSDNNSAFVFYLTSPMTLSATIYQNSATSETVTIYIKSVTSSFFQNLVDGTANSTTISAPSLSNVGTFSIVGGKSKGEYTDSYGVALTSGYYYVYAQSSAGTVNTYHRSISLITAASCPTDPTASRGGTESTPAGGVTLGTVLEPLTCTATGTSVTYQWKQNTTASKDGAVNAVGTGATSASFVPNPASAGNYWYYCVVTDACSNTAETNLSGVFQFNALPTYTVTYKANGGTGSDVVDDEATTVAANPFTRTNYIFTGWNTSADGSGIAYVVGASISSDLTLFAQWTLAPSKCVTFDDDFTSHVTSSGTKYEGITYTYSLGSSISTADGASMPENSHYMHIDISDLGTIDRVVVTIKAIGTANNDSKGVKYGFVASGASTTGTRNNFDSGDELEFIPASSATGFKIMRNGTSIKLEGICVYYTPTCTTPSDVTIAGTWDRFGGETLTLTATPVGGTGTSAYQWKLNGTPIAGATSATYTKENCSVADGGAYTCIVTNGSCDPVESSDPFNVKIYSLQNYTGGTTTYNFTRTGTRTGTVEVTFAASTNHELKIFDGATYYGCGTNETFSADGSKTFSGSGNNVTLVSGLGGTITFAIDYTDGYNPILTVTYPRKKIYVVPNGYTSDNAKLSIYYWRDSNGWSDLLTTDACSGGKYYTEIPCWAQSFTIVRLKNTATSGNWGDKWNQTEDITASNSYDQYTVNTWCSGNDCKESVTAGTFTPSTYTITFNNGGGAGTMTVISGIVCDANQTLPANAYTRANYAFIGWYADVATTINGSSVAAETLITDEATLQHITSNITLTAQWMPIFNFSNGNFHDWGTCAGGDLTLQGSATEISYQLYKDGVASGEPQAGTGSNLTWHVIADGVYTVKSVANATYPETAMPGTADVQLQDPALTGPTTVAVGETITLTHPGYLIAGTNWVSSNTGIATVSTSGVVTGVAAGEVTITFHGVTGCDGTMVITVEGPAEDCEILASATAASTTTMSASVGSVSCGNITGGTAISIDGYSFAIEPADDGNVVLSPKAGKTFAARDSLIVVVYNPTSSTATTGFVIDDDVYEASCASHGLYYFRQLLTEKNLEYGGGNVQLEHHEDAQIVAVWVKHCEIAGSCTEYIWKASEAAQVGSSSPYLYEVAGVGAAMRNATGGSAISFDDMSPACGSSNKMFTTGSSKFAFKTYNNITGITIYGSGTGSNRTLSGCRVGSTTSNYASVVASTDDAFETSGQCDQMYIVFENEIAADSYIEVTFSGNVNISAIKTEYCTTCDATQLIPSSSSISHTYGDSFTEPTFELQETDGTTISASPSLTYQSSNVAIATVNATTGAVSFVGGLGSVTITATYHGEGNYCGSDASYTITVSCAGGESAPKIVPAAGTSLSGCNSSITLYAKQQDGSAYSTGTFQWYRDGEEIEGATTDTYVVLRAGTYTVTYTGSCTQSSTNSAVVTNDVEEPTVERLVPFQYYHVDKTYTTQMKNRHLFAVHSIGSLAGKTYSMTATRNGSALDLSSGYTNVFWVQSGATEDTVMIDLNQLNGKFSAGDEIVFTCSAINCEAISPINETITLYVIDAKPTMAFICSGASGAGTRDKKKFVYNGDFLTGYNKADLCLQDGGTSFDPDEELPLYTYLKTRYRITPVNGYAPFNKLNYEPFDLLLLTDYPKATINTLTENKLDSMYVLADYRPMLSFKTHMVAKTPSSWAAKGFTTAPVVPKAKPQTSMNIVCYSHPMFNALAIGNPGVYRDNEEPDQVVYQMLTEGGYDKEKGIQGFELGDAGNFVTIAFTHFDAKIGTPAGSNVSWNAESDDRKLVAACERQANIEARMILISVNADALCKMTTAGMVVVDSALQYLLITDPERLADCSLIFNDNNGTGVWSDPLNWGPRYNQIPNADLGAHIIRPCTVDRADAVTLNVKIEQTGNLTIPVGSALNVGSTIRRHENRTQLPTTVNDISIAANASGSGTLIFNNPNGDTKASVQMYSKAQTDGSETVANWKWQYIGTPFNDVTDATINYYESWLFAWNGSGWTKVARGGSLTPFVGYCITHPEAGHTYNMTGTLATTATQHITVPAGGYMVVGNSWTAPIQIKNFEDDDLEGIESKSIYFFNTGSDPNGTGTLTENPSAEGTRYAPATYISVPIHAATYVGDSIISAMQGFYVYNSGGSAGTLHLDYNKLVRPKKSWQNILSGPMHAPRRIAAADGEPTVAKLWVCGTNYDDRLVLLEREDFTRTYDSGWDGEKWEGNAISPMVYALNEDGGQEAVTATPDMDGTVIGFRAGEDDEYMFRFNYDGMAEPIYLLDTETQIYTRVLTGNTYTFTCADKDAHNRFLLTRSEGNQVPTGVGNTSDSKDSAKPFKFIGNKKLFIFVNGILYDGTGKRVEERRAAQ